MGERELLTSAMGERLGNALANFAEAGRLFERLWPVYVLALQSGTDEQLSKAGRILQKADDRTERRRIIARLGG